MPSCVPSRMARLNNRLSTYPRPSLLGSTPSEIQNTQAFTWSAIRRMSTAFAICPLYFTCVISSMYLIIGLKMSMSKLVCTPCMTRAILSNPMPVSTFLCGNGSSLPPSLRSYWVNTRFHISTNRSQSQAGSHSFRPQPTCSPWSKNISEHGPQGPFGPCVGAFEGQKLSFSPYR